MSQRERVVAVGLLTERDLALLGQGFRRAYRLPEGEPFHDLLCQIDVVDRRLSFVPTGRQGA